MSMQNLKTQCIKDNPNIPKMRIPLELEHLIKTAQVDTAPKQTNLAECLNVIDARKALEVEHYLRACALRLDLIAGEDSSH